jgi:DNA-binding NarL/FixJ family response regulator
VSIPPIRILCVDDNELVCQALERKFAGLDGFEWCGSLGDAADLVQRTVECEADVVLLDVDMPGPDALSCIPLIQKARPECRVVVLSGMLTQALVDKALDAGASGYLSKADSSGEIIEAVRRVAEGEIVFSPEVRVVCRWPAARQR